VGKKRHLLVDTKACCFSRSSAAYGRGGPCGGDERRSAERHHDPTEEQSKEAQAWGMPDFRFEEEAEGLVAGIDEAGRGPWAGPVVAAAIILDRDRLPAAFARRLDDSKKLKAVERESLFAALPAFARIGIGEASAAEIDRLNILQAALLAMARAMAALPVIPDLALIDGNRPPPLPCPVRCVIGGDGQSLSIAAASIVAKVSRDRIMTALSRRHPGYGWERNAGYGTPEHRQALLRLGITPQHRRSFRPVSNML
jgi:ribonuclease HII